jgi:tRNA dimethylallyltransferase
MALARLTPSTIINMDASQVYADLRILSARPSVEEEAEVPHRLFGHIDGAESCTAARWAEDARAAVVEAHAAGRLPILVGGTGLYMRTLLEGIAPVPDIDPEVRAAVRAMSVAQAFANLVTEDSRAAARLAPTDTTRVARALEVVRSTGRTLKSWQGDRVGGIIDEVHPAPLILLPPRAWLLARCDARFAAMIEAGAIDEVKALRARGLDPALPVMSAIGVRELAAMLAHSSRHAELVSASTAQPLRTSPAAGWTLKQVQGDGSDLSAADEPFATAVAATQLATRQYAKRQYTWFRNQCPPDWPRSEVILNHENIKKLAIILRYTTLT